LANQAVREGKAELQAALEEEMKGSPTLSLTPNSSMVVGDHAVGLGEYRVQASGEGGQAMSIGGAYLTLFHRENGQWKIRGLITNLSGEAPADFFVPSDDETPPDNGTMKAFVGLYTQLYNASDWAGLAALYTEDAKVAFSQSPLLEGAAAIRQRFEERFGASASPKIEIHDVGTMELDADWAVDGGWYRFTANPPSGPVAQGGMYLNLFRRQPDGSWKIHWAVVNGRPEPAPAKAGA
jgi:ketosteroid isomerase-like protein